MRAVDTSVLARLFALDDAGQVAAAQRAIAADSIFVPKTVMIELGRGMDFADGLHLASSGHVEAFMTFDAAMRRRATAMDVRPPVAAP